MAWNDLNMSQRHLIIKKAVSLGIRDLDVILDMYDSIPTDPPDDDPNTNIVSEGTDINESPTSYLVTSPRAAMPSSLRAGMAKRLPFLQNIGLNIGSFLGLVDGEIKDEAKRKYEEKRFRKLFDRVRQQKLAEEILRRRQDGTFNFEEPILIPSIYATNENERDAFMEEWNKNAANDLYTLVDDYGFIIGTTPNEVEYLKNNGYTDEDIADLMARKNQPVNVESEKPLTINVSPQMQNDFSHNTLTYIDEIDVPPISTGSSLILPVAMLGNIRQRPLIGQASLSPMDIGNSMSVSSTISPSHPTRETLYAQYENTIPTQESYSAQSPVNLFADTLGAPVEIAYDEPDSHTPSYLPRQEVRYPANLLYYLYDLPLTGVNYFLRPVTDIHYKQSWEYPEDSPYKPKQPLFNPYEEVEGPAYPGKPEGKKDLRQEDLKKQLIVFDPTLADFTDPYFNLKDALKYRTFKYALAQDKVDAENRHKAQRLKQELDWLFNMQGLAGTDRLKSQLDALKYEYDYEPARFTSPIIKAAYGGSIHIDPDNKGKFNATKARTGKTTEELTHSKNPLTRKRAIFALNAKKWHHAYGGNLFGPGGSLDNDDPILIPTGDVMSRDGLPVLYELPEVTIPAKKLSFWDRFNKYFRSKEGWQNYLDKQNAKIAQNTDAIDIGYNPEVEQYVAHLPIRTGTPSQRQSYWSAIASTQNNSPFNPNFGRYPIENEDGQITGFTDDYNTYIQSSQSPEIKQSEILTDNQGNVHTNPSAGYLSPVDPVAEFYVGGEALAPAFTALGRGAQWGLAKMGNQWARNQVAGRAFNNAADAKFGFYGQKPVTGIMSKAYKNRDVVANEVFNPPGSGKLVHYDRGDHLSSFSFNRPGAYVKDGKLYPGQDARPGYDSYVWFNLDSPYGYVGSHKYDLVDDRYIIINDNGQFRPHPTHDVYKEVVSTQPVDLEDATAFVYNPLLNGWGRTKYVGNNFMGDPFIPTSNGRTYLGLVENPKPKPIITKENVASITDAEWDAAYDNAIKAGDMQEAQRLRDLHFIAKAPDTQISGSQFHGSPKNDFNVFDPSKIGNTDQGWFGKGYYFTPSEEYAGMYGKTRRFYLNAKNIHGEKGSNYFGREDELPAQLLVKRKGAEGEQFLQDLRNSDGVSVTTLQTKPYNGEFIENIVRNNNQMKLADAITYDDAGNIIPLSQRDNFNINDIRYGLFPLGFGINFLNNNNKRKYGGPLKRNTLELHRPKAKYGIPPYKEWHNKMLNNGYNMDPNIYDYKTYYKENPKEAEYIMNNPFSIHLSDRYKKPNHPTFSVESMYSNSTTSGGYWTNENGIDVFNHSPFTYKHWLETANELGKGYDTGDPLTISRYRNNTILPTITIKGKRNNKH